MLFKITSKNMFSGFVFHINAGKFLLNGDCETPKYLYTYKIFLDPPERVGRKEPIGSTTFRNGVADREDDHC